MSYVLNIGSANFDGVTVVDLDGVQIDPATEQYVYNFAAAGRVQLWTGPFFATPLWIQRMSVVTVGAIAVSLRLPNGVVWPVVADWNLLAPQGSELLIDGDAGSVVLYARTINSDNWHRMQCCHQYAPNECVPPTLESATPPTVNDPFTGDIVLEGTGFLPTDDVQFDLAGPGNPITVNSVTWNSPTQITVNITTDGAGVYALYVNRAGNVECASNVLQFIVTAN